jgi:hypothetical protein
VRRRPGADTEIRRNGDALDVVGFQPNGERLTLQGIDEIVCATGQRPDLSLTSELRVKREPWRSQSPRR